MYKDKDKQREADRERQRRHRAKSVTKGVADIRCDKQSVTQYPRVSDQDFTKLMATAGPGHVRVSKPGDADYVPQCETTKALAFVGKDHSMECDPATLAEFRKSLLKRGKDIKCFEDLPLDVQQTIRTVSDTNEEFKRRTVIAIAYQHTFPGRY